MRAIERAHKVKVWLRRWAPLCEEDAAPRVEPAAREHEACSRTSCQAQPAAGGSPVVGLRAVEVL